MSGNRGHFYATAIVAVAFIAMEVPPTPALAQTALYNKRHLRALGRCSTRTNPSAVPVRLHYAMSARDVLA